MPVEEQISTVEFCNFLPGDYNLTMKFQKLIDELLKFRQERDWKQFHNPKNLAASISIEASELLEHYQWLTLDESKKYSQDHKQELADEMADVLNYLVLLAHDLEIDLVKTSLNKIKKNEKKYPVSKSKGSSKKYTKLD